MISDLSPWDKLSLKGKIFELQKKMSIIDIQTKREEEFSYRPALISNYRLLNGRDGNILDSIQKAEVIRRQRKEDLRAQIMQQDQEDCTFSPAINSTARRTHSNNDNRPFYVRLAEKGQRYSESLEKKRAQCRSFDDDGKKMFVPTIIKKDAMVSKDGLPTSKAHGDGSSTADQRSITSTTAAADEFLYLDAFDREERARRKHRQVEEEAEVLANTRKMNSSSLVLLRRRAEKTSRGLFAVLDAEGVGSVGYDDIERYAKRAFIAGSSYGCDSSSIASDMWSMLDPLQTGVATLAAFMRIATPVITDSRSAPSTALERMLTSEGVRLTAKQVESCRAFIKSLVSSMDKTAAVNPVTTAKQEAPYSPPVSKVTQKLARRREEKDRTRLREILVHTAASSVASGLSDDPSVRFDDDDLPPPPPPSLSKYSSDGDDDLNLSLINHHELMYARGLIQQERQKLTAQRVTAETMQDCTFQPRIRTRNSNNSSKNASTDTAAAAVTPAAATTGGGDLTSRICIVKQDGRTAANVQKSKHEGGTVASGQKTSTSTWKSSPEGSSSYSAKIFDRLYTKKVKSRYQRSVEPTAHMVQEMKACTFAPRMSQAFAHSSRHATTHTASSSTGDKSRSAVISSPHRDAEAVATVVSVPGFERAVRRLVVSRSEKQRKKESESDDRQREELEQRYLRSRELARQGVQPFKFALQERRDGKDGVLQQKRSDPDLIVDIKLSSTKSAKIPLWRGDDPSTIASSFGLIYSLDAAAQQLLVDVLLRSMQDHGLEPPDPREAGLGLEAAALVAAVPSTHIIAGASSVRESMIASLIHDAQADASDTSDSPDDDEEEEEEEEEEEFSDYGSSSEDEDLLSLQLQTKSNDGIVETETETVFPEKTEE